MRVHDRRLVLAQLTEYREERAHIAERSDRTAQRRDLYERRAFGRQISHVAFAAIEAAGSEALFINMNAADDEKRAEVIAQLSERFAFARAAGAEPQLGIVLHSLAFGSLQPFLPDGEVPTITRKQMEMTSDVMAHSLVYWTQDLYAAGLIGGTTRIFATSSEGASKAVPMYGAVAAAKAAVEAHCRQLAIELARLVPGATVTALRPGVVDTPALRKIPGSQDWIDVVLKKHPGKRLTTPDDLLNTGVEVEAKPSGKNVRKLSLLSGGERSLTALAYLFAVFRSRPSPFYVMDEVEAALDDVNLHRFLSLVAEFRRDAQLIIVSHQKRTMEAADCLLGVSMQPGGSSKVIVEKVSSSA